MYPSSTLSQYDSVIDKCRELFSNKMNDYGTAWRILRTSSLTDQIFIKANRIRTLEEGTDAKIPEGIESEFIGIINYSVMALIQLKLSQNSNLNLPKEEVLEMYDNETDKIRSLMIDKNNDYGEAWRDMRTTSFTDLILMKLLRIKQIEDNKGLTSVSEGIDAGYQDIVNYSIFALIKLGEEL